MNIFTRMTSTFGLDKITHCAVCYAIAMTINHFAPWHVGLTVAILMGAFKELVDRVQCEGEPSWKDFLADCIGAIAGTIISIL